MKKLYSILILIFSFLSAHADDLQVNINGTDITKPVLSYAGSQDGVGTVTTSNANKTLNMNGNVWKAIDLSNITIKPETVIEFDVSCDVEADVQGIGFDTDLGLTSSTVFKIWGTQTWGIEDYNNYAATSPKVKHYSIPVGQHYTGTYRYMTFVMDHDVASPNAQMTIENIRVRETPAAPLEMEIGQVSAGSNWTTVNLNKSFVDPVVIMGPPSSNNTAPVSVRVRNVTASSFQVKCQEWDYLDGSHVNENISYLVVEKGTHALPGGGQLIAGYISLVNSTNRTVSLNGFSTAPLVLSTVASNNDSSAVTTRISSVSSTSFSMKLQEEELNNQIHAAESVSFIAISSGEHSVSNYELSVGTQGNIKENPVAVDSTGFENFIASFQTANGGDTATMRMLGTIGTDLQVFVEEEKSKDTELIHAYETAGFILAKTIIQSNNWTPEDIASGLTGWYDAADASSITKSGNSVSQWSDKSGQGLHLTQNDAAKQPQSGAQINSLSALDFTGDDMKTSSNPFAPAIQDAFVFMVGKTDSLSQGTAFTLTGSSNAANRWNSHLPWSNGSAFFDAGGTSGGKRLSKGGWAAAGDVWMAGLYNSTTEQVQQIFKDGSLFVGDANASAVNTVGKIFIGSGASGSAQDMTLGEVVILKGTVSAELRQRVEGYLAHKWGITAKLPADHPYKSEAPQKDASWTPQDIASGLTGWYDAADASSITKSGNSVTQWSDKSGQGLHLTQNDAAKQPQAGQSINSLNALDFTGDDMKTSLNPFAPAIQDAFVFMVGKTDSLSQGTAFTLTGSSNAANRWNTHLPWSNGAAFFDAGGTNGGKRLSKGGWAAAGDVWMAGLYNSTTEQVQQIFKNGSLFVGDANASAVNTVGNIFIGSGASGSAQDMTLGEVVILKGTVSAELRQRVEGYLAHKWGLTANLPADHPYKNDPPQKEEAPSPIAGIQYKYYENDAAPWSVLPDFSTLTPKTSGTTDVVSTKIAERGDSYGIVFEGYIDIPTAGTWTFYTISDDGSKLYLDQDLIVNNDGLHGAVEKSGSKDLATGLQAFRLEYFERGGGQTVQLYWQGPGQAKQQVPDSAFLREPISESGETLYRQEFTFDDINRRDTVTLANGNVWQYSYDDLGNLEQAHRAHPTDPQQDKIFNYTYDDIGNRITADDDDSSSPKTYTANDIQQYTQVRFADGSTSNATYDAAGNPDKFLHKNQYIYSDLTWDAEDRLKSFVLTLTGEKTEYGYDYRGFRVWKKISAGGNTHHWTGYIYDGNLVSAEIDLLDPNKKVIRSYTWGLDPAGTKQEVGGIGALVSMEKDGKDYHVVSDAGGNVTNLLESHSDGSLTVANTYEYGPFGQLIKFEESVENPYRFNTKYHDQETDLVYYGYRYYDADNGRWLNRDPIGVNGGINVYNSVSNNMVNGFSGRISYNEGMSLYNGHLVKRFSLDPNGTNFETFKFDAKYYVRPSGIPVGKKAKDIRKQISQISYRLKFGCNDKLGVRNHNKKYPQLGIHYVIQGDIKEPDEFSDKRDEESGLFNIDLPFRFKLTESVTSTAKTTPTGDPACLFVEIKTLLTQSGEMGVKIMDVGPEIGGGIFMRYHYHKFMLCCKCKWDENKKRKYYSASFKLLEFKPISHGKPGAGKEFETEFFATFKEFFQDAEYLQYGHEKFPAKYKGRIPTQPLK